jgi:hypothetical protein
MATMGTRTPLSLEPQQMQIVRAEIRGVFANLSDAFEVTSWLTDNYNCIAWAAGDSQKWWWPDPEGESFWPRGIDRKDTVEAFIAAFGTIGYEPCDSHDLEAPFEKVAIYATGNSTKHMARQLSSGAWTSKLGEWWDIDHPSIEEIEGAHYGVRVQILRRPYPTKT